MPRELCFVGRQRDVTHLIIEQLSRTNVYTGGDVRQVQHPQGTFRTSSQSDGVWMRFIYGLRSRDAEILPEQINCVVWGYDG